MGLNNATLQWLNNTNLSAYAKTSYVDTLRVPQCALT